MSTTSTAIPRLLYIMLMLLLLPTFIVADTADQVCSAFSTARVVSQGADIILRSRIVGQTVRQCSCVEQRECIEEMKNQARECSVPCFAEFKAITNRPDELKRCFDEKDDILQGFLSCFEHKVEGCVATRMGPRIPKTNIQALFSIGEHRIVNQSSTIQSIIAPIKHIVNAAGEFAKCIKNCFLAKNAHGFCFDRFNCQPLIGEKKAKASFRQCTKEVNWKREAGEFCDCSVNAGVSDLKQFCAMFHLMSKKAGGRTRS